MLEIWPLRSLNWQNISPGKSLVKQRAGSLPAVPVNAAHDAKSSKCCHSVNSAERAQKNQSSPSSGHSQVLSYAKLQSCLSAGQLRAADYETYQLMLQAADRQAAGWLRPIDLDGFSCSTLQAIDQLWLQYSNWRFGFSRQQRIWEEVAQDYELFGQQVGWKIAHGWAAYVNRGWVAYNDLTFDYSAPPGHFPSGWTQHCDLLTCIGGCGYVGLEDIFDRLTVCELSGPGVWPQDRPLPTR